MLRWLIYILVTANLVIFLWLGLGPDNRIPMVVQQEEGDLRVIRDDPEEQEVPDAEQAVRYCYASLPFSNKLVADDIISTLAAEGLGTSLHKESLVQPPEYHLILPAPSSSVGIIQKQLRDAGIEGAEIITAADGQQTILLDIFLVESNMADRIVEVESAGFAPRVLKKSGDLLLYSVHVSTELEQDAFHKLLNKKDMLYDGQMFSSFPCAEIVSGN
ncbi:hypothetical protein BOW35_07300 [Solemya velum gill symbiont]|uniref:hypothetical protein n=1 Tax=Solemya velum gill symbiont TaxID=2340 RepID=UPI000996C618|nr:hypothetical protein [Solemya velum gill symbiont]OOZ19708.1 hypothetical protein BOW29_05450 [Solemya velum gill symbiont]OOZ22056.1 hypothetical protein BOW30_07270 [Solemya velum gill symbiont]OOZ25389.1 hypothetical protein BOW31_01105 [Solemya velum gill symbiont]OOZ29513.1 hypothetical protein BOW33_05230 [Solemya velum gill symbiont]OOZ31640.1 hypothetical protein BOW34_07015 [Solemya velum gill symbiont]